MGRFLVFLLIITLTFAATVSIINKQGAFIYKANINNISETNIIDISGSFTSNKNTYQYIYLTRDNINYASDQTPLNDLPKYDESLTQVSISSINEFEHNDRITHSLFLTKNLVPTPFPINSQCKHIQKIHLLDNQGEILCYQNGDFCHYPIFYQGNQWNNSQDIQEWIKTHIHNDFIQSKKDGSFLLLVDCNSTLLFDNISVLEFNTKDAFITTINTTINDRIYVPCITAYELDDKKRYGVAKDTYVNIIIHFGSSYSHYEGYYGVNKRITYRYTESDPELVNITIIGNLTSWSCTILHDEGPSKLSPMTTDIIQWGNTGLKQADFWPEYNLKQISAGPAPVSIIDRYYFFPYKWPVNENYKVWQNLDQWDFSETVIGNGMFYHMSSGILNLTGISFPKLKYGYQMFNEVSIPIIGNLTDLRMPLLEQGENLFYGYSGGPIDISQLQMGNCKNFNYMFATYDSNEQDISMWNTTSAETMEGFLLDSKTNWPNLNITYWNTPKLRNMRRFLHECNGTKPIFTNWDLSNIEQCDGALDYRNGKGMDPTVNYDNILITFRDKTKFELKCTWNTNLEPQTISGQTAKEDLINKGWIF